MPNMRNSQQKRVGFLAVSACTPFIVSLLFSVSLRIMAISGLGSRNERICVPGEFLFNVDDGFVPGNGAYSIHGRIHSGLAGVVSISKVGSFKRLFSLLEILE